MKFNYSRQQVMIKENEENNIKYVNSGNLNEKQPYKEAINTIINNQLL